MSAKEETLVGVRMAEARGKLCLSQSQLAEHCGLTQVSIFKIESGKTLRSRHFPQIAQQLGVSLDWLLHGGEYPFGLSVDQKERVLSQAWVELDQAISALLSATPAQSSAAAMRLERARKNIRASFLRN